MVLFKITLDIHRPKRGNSKASNFRSKNAAPNKANAPRGAMLGGCGINLNMIASTSTMTGAAIDLVFICSSLSVSPKSTNNRQISSFWDDSFIYIRSTL